MQLLQQIAKKYPNELEQLVQQMLNDSQLKVDVESQVVVINLLADGFCHGYTQQHGCVEVKVGST